MTDLLFAGLKQPVRFFRCPMLLGQVRRFFHSWPHEEVAPSPGGAVIHVRAFGREEKGYDIRAPWLPEPLHEPTMASALCSLAIELVAAFGEEHPDVTCLHAAAVQLDGNTVLLLGESGTGKEVMASSIHNASRRHDKPFLAINCASIPATLMESELFGYEPGAFTGGRKNGAPGMFESAHGGTLFLDEIGEMPFELQAKLLRVIQERRVRRIGSSRELPVDVRIVAATNKILEHEVAQHRFRVDLYYRLNILHIHMLPLRDYADNISDIAGDMLSRLAPESSSADQKHLRNLLKKLNSYDWPGNMRELENMVRRYAALSPYLKRPVSLGDIFTRPDLQERTTGSVPSRKDQELQRIREAFDRLHGNRAQIARELGISRSTLWRKLKMLH